MQTFFDNLHEAMTQENIEQIEQLTKGQHENANWHIFRKYVITVSKGHEVLTKMRKIQHTDNKSINMYDLFQKISGLAYVNPNIPALKYGRSIEIHAVNKFQEIYIKEHKEEQQTECGLFLHNEHPFNGGSPNRLVSCSCCEKACLEVNCPMSINNTSPQDSTVKLAYLLKDDNNTLGLNRKHKYYTQCQIQMGVTALRKCFFFVWTSNGYFVEEIQFDVELWDEMTKLFPEFYHNYYINSFFG